MTARLEDKIDPAKHRTRLVPGYAGEGSTISIGGLVQPAIWLQHVEAVVGDPVQILVVDRPDAPSLAVVIGVSGKFSPGLSQPREGTVATAPMGSDTVTVTTAAGPVSATLLESYDPGVGDRVRLLWQAGEATLLGKVGVTPTREPLPEQEKRPTAAPPPGSRGGAETFTASDSATWSTRTGSWNSYFGKSLYQGSYPATGNNRGAWFYHGKPGKLSGRSISRVRIWIPERHRAGAYNSAVAVHLYLHASRRRPGKDVRRGSGTTVSVPAGWKGGWKDLPTSWGSDLIDGNGIGISGGSYAGFEGITGSGKSGQLHFEWEG